MDIALEHALSIVVALPAAVALLLLTCGLAASFVGYSGFPVSVWRAVGLATSVLTFGLSVGVIWLGFDPALIGLQGVETFGGLSGFGARIQLGLDGIALCFFLSTTALVPLAILASIEETEESIRSWIFLCLLLETSLLGTIAATNFMTYLFFWALTILPVLLWLGLFGGEERTRAANRVWVTEAMGLAGLLFVAFVLRDLSVEQLGFATLDLASGAGAGLSPGGSGFEDAGRTLLDVKIERADQATLLLAMSIALALRFPLVPFHFWLPGVHSAAPTGLSVLLATGFVQTAAMGVLRFALPLFPDAVEAAGPALSIVGISALAYASLVALVQKELKRLVAYASVGYAGFAIFGISTLNVQGVTGAVMQLLMHGLATAGLFVLIGVLAKRRGTTEVAAFGGLAKPMPVCAFFFGLMVLSLMGLPLLGGFVGDLFVLVGSLETRRALSVVALIAMVLSASYLLWVQRRIYLGPVDEPANRGLIDLDRVERGVLLAMAIPLVVIGVYPNPVLRRVEPAVLEIFHQMEVRSVSLPAVEPESEPPATKAKRSKRDSGKGKSQSRPKRDRGAAADVDVVRSPQSANESRIASLEGAP
ncbi:MAG: NuoM family protein [Myxococcota bacterium]